MRQGLLYSAKSFVADDPKQLGAVDLVLTNMFDKKSFVADDALCARLQSAGTASLENPFFCRADAAARFRFR